MGLNGVGWVASPASTHRGRNEAACVHPFPGSIKAPKPQCPPPHTIAQHTQQNMAWTMQASWPCGLPILPCLPLCTTTLRPHQSCSHPNPFPACTHRPHPTQPHCLPHPRPCSTDGPQPALLAMQPPPVIAQLYPGTATCSQMPRHRLTVIIILGSCLLETTSSSPQVGGSLSQHCCSSCMTSWTSPSHATDHGTPTHGIAPDMHPCSTSSMSAHSTLAVWQAGPGKGRLPSLHLLQPVPTGPLIQP